MKKGDKGEKICKGKTEREGKIESGKQKEKGS
jgi:hypothetical protein